MRSFINTANRDVLARQERGVVAGAHDVLCAYDFAQRVLRSATATSHGARKRHGHGPSTGGPSYRGLQGQQGSMRPAMLGTKPCGPAPWCPSGIS